MLGRISPTQRLLRLRVLELASRECPRTASFFSPAGAGVYLIEQVFASESDGSSSTLEISSLREHFASDTWEMCVMHQASHLSAFHPVPVVPRGCLARMLFAGVLRMPISPRASRLVDTANTLSFPLGEPPV